MATEFSSFRDPSGWLFWEKGKLYRAITDRYKADYDLLFSSGLYDTLVKQHLLIPHQEVSPSLAKGAYKVIQPELVPFISYPYEWSFSQLKDAALLTLQLQKQAIEHGMSLKDASAYNIQFVEGKPILIDTLSFETLQSKPWVAYRQFCQHFLAPLALMATVDFKAGQLLRSYIDGIPLDLAAKLLPHRTKLSPSLLMHVHLHASSQKRHAADGKTGPIKQPTMSKTALLGLIQNLEGAISRLDWQGGQTEWGDYYQANHNYIDEAMRAKLKTVKEMLKEFSPKTVWDLGGNTGRFTQLAVELGAEAICWDIDPVAVEATYRHIKQSGQTHLLPLWQDFTNPSPNIGWELKERLAVAERGQADVVMALALIHHLAIGNNVPLTRVGSWLAGLCSKGAIVEFMPKSDSQVEKLLTTREDIFDSYSQEGFEEAMSEFFTIAVTKPVKGSKRILYLLKKKAMA